MLCRCFMNRNFLVLCVALLLLTPVFGQAPKELEDLKSQFEKSPQTEADRQQYITSLAKLRDKFA